MGVKRGSDVMSRREPRLGSRARTREADRRPGRGLRGVKRVTLRLRSRTTPMRSARMLSRARMREAAGRERAPRADPSCRRIAPARLQRSSCFFIR